MVLTSRGALHTSALALANAARRTALPRHTRQTFPTPPALVLLHSDKDLSRLRRTGGAARRRRRRRGRWRTRRWRHGWARRRRWRRRRRRRRVLRRSGDERRSGSGEASGHVMPWSALSRRPRAPQPQRKPLRIHQSRLRGRCSERRRTELLERPAARAASEIRSGNRESGSRTSFHARSHPGICARIGFHSFLWLRGEHVQSVPRAAWLVRAA